MIMNCEGGVIVLDDEEEDGDIVEINCNDEDEPAAATPNNNASFKSSVQKKKTPPIINGYNKPTYSFCQLITQALAVCPGRKATALRICELIAERQPYYKHHTGHWQGSVYSSLTKRKKFFMIVSQKENGEYVWSFNPAFEKYMLDKWVPKYLRLNANAKLNTTPTAESSAGRSHTVVNLEHSGPVIASTESLKPTSVEAVPEFDLTDPDQSTEVVNNNSEQSINPWEPEISLSESADSETQRAVRFIPEIENEELKCSVSVDSRETGTEGIGLRLSSYKDLTAAENKDTDDPVDFGVEKLNSKFPVKIEEIFYRLNFHKDHPDIKKFRLHCTVCDVHLGTAGSVVQANVRMHVDLGVLTCCSCYNFTIDAQKKNVSACHWCAQVDGAHFLCSGCPLKFCENCVKRNFGLAWCSRIALKAGWQCFLCDTKQIWPHRAIAYFLLCHYGELLRKKKRLTRGKKPKKDEDLLFFTEDLTTCCKGHGFKSYEPMQLLNYAPASSETEISCTESPPSIVSALPLPLLPQPTKNTPSSAKSGHFNGKSNSAPSVLQEQQHTIGNKTASHIYVHTNTPVPSLTLNTGTQYIHNVYPDKNYVFVEAQNENSADHSINEIDVPHAQSSMPQRPLYTSGNTSASQFRTPSNEYIQQPVSSITNLQDSNTSCKSKDSLTTSNNFSLSSNNPTNKPILIPNEANECGSITTSISKNHSTVVSDNGLAQPSSFEVTVLPPHSLTAKERIERRPMPKSKKQSLLRAVLMNESIQSMKRHLQSSDLQADVHDSNIDANLSCPKETELLNITDLSDNSSAQATSSNSEENIEEPILKSIIHTATERLLNLQKKQSSSFDVTMSCSSNENRPTNEQFIDLSKENNMVSSQHTERIDDNSPVHIPKIKIRTLKELQAPEIVELQESVKNINEPSEVQKCNESSKKVEVEEPSKEINVTGLKQGIIEASRTLVNTQKKFKELAKIISSNLSYQTEQAAELVNKFQDILKSCRKQIDVIDKSIKNQFGYLIPNNDIDSILESIKKSENSTDNFDMTNLRKKIKSKLHPKKMSYVVKKSLDVGPEKDNAGSSGESNLNASEPSGIFNEKTRKRKRDLVDINPLGKKIIIGTPEVTQEDLALIPTTWVSQCGLESNSNNEPITEHESIMKDLVKRQQFLRNSKKKRDIWISKRRRNSYFNKSKVIYNKDGSIRKRIGRPPKSSRPNEDDETDYSSFPPKPKYDTDQRLRKRFIKPCIPLRYSERNHASTAANVASFLSSTNTTDNELRTPSLFPVKYVIKPCSVILHRLNPKFVELLEKRHRHLAGVVQS